MKTPKEYRDNLKKCIITKQMLSDCLYSVNKRATNWRDMEREYRHNRHDYYDNEEKAREKKQYYYSLKIRCLLLLNLFAFIGKRSFGQKENESMNGMKIRRNMTKIIGNTRKIKNLSMKEVTGITS